MFVFFIVVVFIFLSKHNLYDTLQRLSTTIHWPSFKKDQDTNNLNEHKNAIKRTILGHFPLHTRMTIVILNFNWTHTEILGQAQTKQTREFKEAWHSMD
jgi:hypothetical protein